MSVFDSLRVLAAMARVTVPSVAELRTHRLRRHAIDERARWFGRRVMSLLDVDLVTTGADLVLPGRSYVYMSNHQSHLDIPVLYATLPSPTIRMLAKKELFQIPIWGRALRAAEFIEVDRADHLRALESIERAAQLLRDGVSIYLAPEGTRSRNGRIGPLKKGGFHLALKTGTSIVPVAIRGTIDILPRGSYAMRVGKRVDVAIGAPIPTSGASLGELRSAVGAFLRHHVEQIANLSAG